MGDNRSYIWSAKEIIYRIEYPFIEKWITHGSRVIDLGCGNGSLLRVLKRKNNIKEFGIEISESGVSICKENGLNVKQGRIDTNLDGIQNDSFDFAICNVTIQMVFSPEVTILEMKRIAKCQIISFPNFAFLLQRLQLAFLGKMPDYLLYGYTWYNTGHLHQLSIKDFKNTIAPLELVIKDSEYLVGKHRLPKYFLPNLFATEAIMCIEKR